MLKPSFQLKDKQDDESDIYLQTKLHKGLLPSMVLPTQNFTDGGVQPPQLSRGKPQQRRSPVLVQRGVMILASFCLLKM